MSIRREYEWFDKSSQVVLNRPEMSYGFKNQPRSYRHAALWIQDRLGAQIADDFNDLYLEPLKKE